LHLSDSNFAKSLSPESENSFFHPEGGQPPAAETLAHKASGRVDSLTTRIKPKKAETGLDNSVRAVCLGAPTKKAEAQIATEKSPVVRRMHEPMALDNQMLSHGSNITQKIRICTEPRLKALCTEVVSKYNEFVQGIALDETLRGSFDGSVAALNKYVDFVKTIEKIDSFFNWRSDFAGSVIPEYIYRVIHARLEQDGIAALFSTRSSVVEMTLAGTAAGGWDIRRKNQDLCIGLRKEILPSEEGDIEFIVPQIAFEVKTNIDINKLNGLDFSAERLKRSFPAAKYFLVTETIDFSLSDNYSAGSIDEIYVGRRQMRSLARRAKGPLQPEVFRQLVDDVTLLMKKASMDRVHVYDRLVHGKLINAKSP
jgi:hypothetical protein